MYGFMTLLYQIVIILLSIHAFDCTHRKIPAGSVEKRYLSILPPGVQLKITKKANLLLSIAIVTARVTSIDDDPPAMMETVSSPFGWTIRFGAHFWYTSVSFILRKYFGLSNNNVVAVIKPLRDLAFKYPSTCS